MAWSIHTLLFKPTQEEQELEKDLSKNAAVDLGIIPQSFSPQGPSLYLRWLH